MTTDQHTATVAALAAVAEAVRPSATQALIATRGRTHGEYRDHADYAQRLKAIMQGADKWPGLNVCQKESLEMIAHKIGRILAGDPDFRDHWDDIAGYAMLVAERCAK